MRGGAERLVILAIAGPVMDVAEQTVPAHIDEIRCQVEVGAIASCPVQLDESHLDLRVTGNALHPPRSEDLMQVVGEAPGHGEEAVIARSSG
jgi:hypothetical protein